MERLPQSRNGRLAVGCGGLLSLCFVAMLCSNLISGGAPPATPVPTAAAQPLMAVESEPAATATTKPTATDKPAATVTEPATEKPTDVPTDVPTAAPTQAPTAAPAVYNPNPDEDRDCGEWEGRGGGTAAQAWWRSHITEKRPNPGGLDGNNNGVPCEDNDRSAPPPPPTAAPAAAVANCININTAGFEELRQIPEIDEKIANEIIAERPFASWNQLVAAINGIGPKNVEQVKTRGCLQ